MSEAVSNINRLPTDNGTSKNLIPSSIVTGSGKVDFNILKLCFGTCIEVYKDNGYQTNSVHARATPSMSLNAVNNSTGSYWIYSLVTGRNLNRGQLTERPMPPCVINRIDDIGSAQGQPHAKSGNVNFNDPFDEEPPVTFPPTLNDDNDDDSHVPSDEELSVDGLESKDDTVDSNFEGSDE